MKKQIIRALQKTIKDFSRIKKLSLIGFALCLAIIILEITGLLRSAHVKFISDFFILGFFFLTLFLPVLEYFFPFVVIAIGLINIYFGGDLLGMLFMVFGLMVALRHGWLRQYAKTKLGLFFVSFALILFFQYKRYGITLAIVSAVDITLALACIAGFIFLFFDQIKPYLIDKKPLSLNSRNFTKRQITCIYGVLNRKTTKKISSELEISQSAVKKELVGLYTSFGVSNYMELYLYLSDHEVFL